MLRMSRDRLLRLRDRARTPTPVPSAARAPIPPTSHTPGQEAVLRLQRTAGNRATAAAVQRKALTSGGVLTGFEFIVGRDVTVGFARAAKSSVRDGVVSTADLSALRAAGLVGDESVSDHEQLFMAGLLDPGNARALRSTAFGASGDAITFAAGTVTPARRARVEAVDRPQVPAGVDTEVAAAGAALRSWDLAGMFAHRSAAEAAATVAIISMTTGFAPTVTAALALADAHGLPRVDLLHGMVNAAADGTAGDLALAAAVLAVAKAESHPLIGDIASGRLHVDQVPASAMPGGPSHNADYVTVAQDSGHKGDTIYLPSGLDITNPYQRSVVVHELRHAIDDKAAAGAKVQFLDKAQLELAAYRAQGDSLLSQLSGTSGAPRTALARQIGAEWGDLVLLGMLVASRADRATADPLITLVNTEAPAARQLPAALLTGLLGRSVANLETTAIRAIQAAYSLPAGAIAPLDGLAGESIVDWINRL